MRSFKILFSDTLKLLSDQFYTAQYVLAEVSPTCSMALPVMGAWDYGESVSTLFVTYSEWQLPDTPALYCRQLKINRGIHGTNACTTERIVGFCPSL